MSYTSLATKFGASVIALSLGGCAALGDRAVGLERQQVGVTNSVRNNVVLLNACEREGIKPRPATMVTQQEMYQRTRAGEVNYLYNGYYLFAKKSLVEQWAPIAGALIVGGLTNGVGSAGVRVATTVAGAGAGAWAGEKLSDQAILERMAKEKGCEDEIDAKGAAPLRTFITGQPADRPHGAPPRVLDRQDYMQGHIAPYSAPGRKVYRTPGFGD